MITKANALDADSLTNIALKSKAYWGYTEEQIESWRHDLTITENIMKNMFVYKFTLDDTIAGFYILNQPKNDAIELEFLFILPEFIGKGIGKKLLEDSYIKAKQLNATTMTLLADPNAKSFYESQGFLYFGEKESSIPNRFCPLMKKDLTL